MNEEAGQSKATGTRQGTNDNSEKRPSTLGRLVRLILLLVAILGVCWFCLYGTDFLKFVLSPWWNSQDQLAVIKGWADAVAIALGAISALITLILAFEPRLTQKFRKALGIGAAALTLILAFGSISQKISDRLSELSPLQGITATYNWDGSKTYNLSLFGNPLVWPAPQNIEVLKQMGKLEGTRDWTRLLHLAEKQKAKTPEWLTPYLASALSHYNLGQESLARKDCAFILKHANAAPRYSQVASNLLDPMNRFAAAKKNYSGLDNAGLRDQTLRLCQDIRRYCDQFALSDSSAIGGEVLTTELLRSTNRTLFNEYWRTNAERRSKRYEQAYIEYDKRFAIPAMVLATNLMSRLPKEKWPSRPAGLLYAFNPYGGGVSCELERLALLLPRAGNLLYSRMGNRQLQSETFNFVGRLRDFTILCQKRVHQLEDAQWNKRRSEGMATNQILIRERWNEERKADDSLRREQQAEYDESFRAEALILRAELLSRYPKGDSPAVAGLDGRPRTIADDLHFFEWCSGARRFEFIADTLEVLGKQLPVGK